MFARHHKGKARLTRAAVLGVIVPFAALGLAGSAFADDYTTLQFGPNWTAVGDAWSTDANGNDLGVLGTSAWDSLTSSQFAVPALHSYVSSKSQVTCPTSGKGLCYFETTATVHPTLKFNLTMFGTPSSTADEHMAVVVVDGGTVTNIWDYYNTSQQGSQAIDLTPWAGKSIRIEFEMQQPTWSNAQDFVMTNPDLGSTNTYASQLVFVF
jgi:hypothetical protein